MATAACASALGLLLLAIGAPPVAAAARTGAGTNVLADETRKFTGVRQHWNVLRKQSGGTSYYDRPTINSDDATRGVLRAGYASDDGGSTARTLLQLDTSRVARTHILWATLRLWQAWSSKDCGNGNESGGAVDVYQVPAFGSGTTWNAAWNSTAWGSNLGGNSRAVRRTGGGYQGRCPADYVAFDVTGAVRGVAAAGGTSISLGLRAENESDEWSWKRYLMFATANAKNPSLDIGYNTIPGAPAALVTEDDSAPGDATDDTLCVTGPARPAVTSLTPTLSAQMKDGDGSTHAEFEWSQVGAARVGGLQTGLVADGANISAVIPAGQLQEGGTYSWRVRGYDLLGSYGTDYGPWSRSCEFTIETPGPANSPPLPTVTSADFVRDDFGPTPAGVPGTVTFAGQDVVAFRYGFRQDALAMTVQARPDGTAEAPITMTHDNPAELWVQAVDRAGNKSVGPDGDAATGIARYPFQAATGSGQTPHLRGDLNGDGRADVTVLTDGGGRAQVWNVAGASPVNVFDAGAFPLAKVKSAAGDFDGDGRTDLAMFRDEGNGRTTLHLLRSDGNALAGTQVWESATWNWAKTQVVAGNFDGDAARRDDLAVLYDLGGATMDLRVFLGTAAGFAAPATWASAARDATKIKLVAADFDADGDHDLAEVRDLGSRIGVYLLPSTRTSFAAPATWYDDPSRGWSWTGSKFVAADVSGDGRPELAAFYRYGELAHTAVYLFANHGGGFTNPPLQPLWQSGDHAWDWNLVDPSAGDLDGDGDEDLVAAYGCCGPGQHALWRFTAGGGTVAAPQPYWRGSLSTAGRAGVQIDPAATYQLMASHSGRCLAVSGASTADNAPMIQYDCGSQRFRVVATGAAQFMLQPAHVTGKCVSAGSATAAGTKAFQYVCGPPYGDQAYRLDYVAGSGDDTLVRVRPMHSGNCLDVEGPSLLNNALIHQWTCLNTASQEFYLRRS
ncbi:hypothetical protein Acor_00990 [Acrocarpospora corrugata]|uniref:Ricin B lectin domain-containing protein n=1 Tax=Acrocarpospora corrugata TaxID=35763 RepID=A0A5M3VUJ5_9ACTN|nr:hypothetical protein Acor_00990 [Acrocarpospora corrugata]